MPPSEVVIAVDWPEKRQKTMKVMKVEKCEEISGCHIQNVTRSNSKTRPDNVPKAHTAWLKVQKFKLKSMLGSLTVWDLPIVGLESLKPCGNISLLLFFLRKLKCSNQVALLKKKQKNLFHTLRYLRSYSRPRKCPMPLHSKLPGKGYETLSALVWGCLRCFYVNFVWFSRFGSLCVARLSFLDCSVAQSLTFRCSIPSVGKS